MRFRITIVLMLALGGLTAVAVGSVLVVSATASFQNTLELTRKRAQLTIFALEQGVTEHLAPALNMLEQIADRVADGTLDLSDREQVAANFTGALAAAPQLGGGVIWQPGKPELWVRRLTDGSIRVRNIAAQPAETFAQFTADFGDGPARTLWNRPSYLDGQSYVNLRRELKRDGVTVGVVGTGISISSLSRFVGQLTLDDLTPFILYGEDRVLAHPSLLAPAYFGKIAPNKPLLSLADIDDPVLENFPNLRRIGPPGPALRDAIDFRETSDGTDQGEEVGETRLNSSGRTNGFGELPWRKSSSGRAQRDRIDVRETPDESRDNEDGGGASLILSRSTTAFGDVPWRIGAYSPVESVNRQIRRLIGSIFVGLGMMVVAVAASLFLARRIARPITALSSAAERIERLELDSIAPLRGSIIRELDEQARSFNRMVQGLRWFQAYVPRRLVQKLMDETGRPEREVQEARLTVMFTDVVGFTHLSETMPAAEVVSLLNDHFEIINGIVEAEEGTLDKFIGDAAMAFWGAPEALPDHAERACRAALAIAQAVTAHAEAAGGPSLRIKIGLHTGPLIVGNIGARTRMNYTVIGDTVNVCARVETLAGEFAGDSPAIVLASGEVVDAVGDAFRFESLGAHQVKGRDQPVQIWRLVGQGTAR